MLVIDKNRAEYLRQNLDYVSIYKTMKSKGSKQGVYYVEETSVVKRLLSQYKDGQYIKEEYPPTGNKI